MFSPRAIRDPSVIDVLSRPLMSRVPQGLGVQLDQLVSHKYRLTETKWWNVQLPAGLGVEPSLFLLTAAPGKPCVT